MIYIIGGLEYYGFTSTQDCAQHVKIELKYGGMDPKTKISAKLNGEILWTKTARSFANEW